MPITEPAWVRFDSVAEFIARAMPKSATFTWPFEPIITLAGLTSRWARPASWANPSAAATSEAISADCLGVSCLLVFRISARFRPCTYSIAMKYVPSYLPQSYTLTMFGWLRLAAAWASRRKRSTKFGSIANSGKRIFIATWRSSSRSRAKKTSAIPPRPTRLWIS